MLLYFAGPLFNDNELAFNARLTDAIEALGYDVFLPQRDGYELGSNPETAGTEAEAHEIFDLDRDNVRHAMSCCAFSTGEYRTRAWRSSSASATQTASTTSPAGG